MNRRRTHDRHLPRNVYRRHSAYYYVKAGKWTRLGADLHEALARYAALYDRPQGGMSDLIDTALATILPNVSANTARQYRAAGRKLADMLAEFTPEQVRPKDVAAIKVGLASTPNMANRCLSVLRQVMHYAVEHQLIDSNPAIGIKRHTEAKRTRLVTLAEYRAIHDKAGPRLRAIMALLLLTGQRVGDVLAIKRADLTDDGIRFRQQKTDVPLVVKWTPELREAVEQAKSLHPFASLTLFRNRMGKAPDYRTVRDQWDEACRAAGVRDARLHDLRAMSLTAARAQGKDATALAGHSSAAMTARYLRDRAGMVVEGPSFGQAGQLLDTKARNR